MRWNLGLARRLRSEVGQTIGFCRLSSGASPAEARQTTKTDRLSYLVCATDSRQVGQLIFLGARKKPGNIRSSESHLDILTCVALC
jgi:hypothetical protein